MKIREGNFFLSTEETPKGLLLTGYEGEGAVLDLSGREDLFAVGKKAFLNCRSLQKVILPGTVLGIGDWAFSKCRSLRSVRIDKKADGSIFGKGVFEGCDMLERIRFSDMDEGASALYAATANRMNNEHLLRAKDPGERFWYEKWDLSLLSLLRSDDAESSDRVALCGEEDISFDGVGMVDGEMPGETDDYVKKIGIGKCRLCYLRLRYPENLAPGIRETIGDYLRERAFGTEKDRAWEALKEDFDRNTDHMRIYLDVIRPDREKLLRMIDDLDASRVLAKALLIREAAGKEEGSGIDSLMI
ncbi:MAG: leucine-rich repeat domain-containing protein [Lachnospiraceae bacterium]|nr:leucine-rich repeat domain-containing protein [Lachnospiraceae bacterium]